MSIHRRAAKRDENEIAIIEALTKAGASVSQISGAGVPDLLVGHHNRTYLAEIKSRKGKLTPAQDKFQAEWRGGYVYILRSVEDATDMLNSSE